MHFDFSLKELPMIKICFKFGEEMPEISQLMLRVGSSSGLFLKAGAGAGGELAHKVRIF
jgi:hypothetical protein